MPKNVDSIGNVIKVALLICIVCSILVSTAAVMLKPVQDYNKALEKKKNILYAAGLMKPGEEADVDALFDSIDAKVIDIKTGEFVDIDPKTHDVRAAAKDPATSIALDGSIDIATIKKIAKNKLVYLVRENNAIKRIVLPIHGLGLWATMYGFLALDKDLTTIKSMLFYQHAETPGLGAEIDNPFWKSKWIDKKAFDANGAIAIDIIKGTPPAGSIHKVDGITGATLTCNGVENVVRFWIGENGYGPFLNKLKQGGGR